MGIQSTVPTPMVIIEICPSKFNRMPDLCIEIARLYHQAQEEIAERIKVETDLY